MKIADLYKKHKCWTWYSNYQWFKEECLINDAELPRVNKKFGHISPINFIKTDIPDKSNFFIKLFDQFVSE